MPETKDMRSVSMNLCGTATTATNTAESLDITRLFPVAVPQSAATRTATPATKIHKKEEPYMTKRDAKADNTQKFKEMNKTKNYHIYSTKDNRTIPTGNMTPDDFSDDKYEGRYIMQAHDGSTVIVTSSFSAEPARWRIVHGNCASYFLSHEQAMDYCKECGYKFLKGGVEK